MGSHPKTRKAGQFLNSDLSTRRGALHRAANKCTAQLALVGVVCYIIRRSGIAFLPQSFTLAGGICAGEQFAVVAEMVDAQR
jgi:hypothetical protein